MLKSKIDFEDHLAPQASKMAGTKDHAEKDVFSTKRFKTTILFKNWNELG